jgi:hypothetical protein
LKSKIRTEETIREHKLLKQGQHTIDYEKLAEIMSTKLKVQQPEVKPTE